MKLKLYELQPFIAALSKVGEKPLDDFNLARKLAKTLMAARQAMETLEEMRAKIAKKHAGDAQVVPPERIGDYERDWLAVLGQETEIEHQPLTLGEIQSIKPYTAMELIQLQRLCEEKL